MSVSEIDIRAVEKAIPSVGRITGLHRFSGGQSNPTYRLDSDRGRFVLRRKPGGEMPRGAHAIDREFRLLSALATTAVPVPRVHGYVSDVSAIGAEFYVMEFLDGAIHWDPVLPGVDRTLRTGVHLAMIRALACLHDVDTAASGLADFGRPGGYAARQIALWSRQTEAAGGPAVPGMADLETTLQDRLPPDDGQAGLVHGDYRIDNLVFSKDTPSVLGILDWELATLGHPFSDIGYVLMHHRLPNAGVFRGLGGIDRQKEGLPTEAELLQDYCRGRALGRTPDLTFWIGLSAFRLAAIIVGIRSRIAAGTASDPERGRRLVDGLPTVVQVGLDALRHNANAGGDTAPSTENGGA